MLEEHFKDPNASPIVFRRGAFDPNCSLTRRRKIEAISDLDKRMDLCHRENEKRYAAKNPSLMELLPEMINSPLSQFSTGLSLSTGTTFENSFLSQQSGPLGALTKPIVRHDVSEDEEVDE